MLERILLKLTSTKFWSYVSVLVVAALALCNAGDDTVTKVSALIIAFGNCVCYTFANVWQKSQYNDSTEIVESITVDGEEEEDGEED
jgi:hypothetical protein